MSCPARAAWPKRSRRGGAHGRGRGRASGDSDPVDIDKARIALPEPQEIRAVIICGLVEGQQEGFQIADAAGIEGCRPGPQPLRLEPGQFRGICSLLSSRTAASTSLEMVEMVLSCGAVSNVPGALFPDRAAPTLESDCRTSAYTRSATLVIAVSKKLPWGSGPVALQHRQLRPSSALRAASHSRAWSCGIGKAME